MHSTRFLRKLLIPGFLSTLLTLASCGEAPRPVNTTSHLRLSDEKLIGYNRGVVRTEDREIDDFLARYGWDMERTSTGLRYLIYKRGDGEPAGEGATATFGYTVSLLTGELVYTSDSLGEKTILLGHGGVESGLEEGLLLMRRGDCAKLIIPSYLGFGLLGDLKKIPPGATLVYDVKLTDLKTTN